MEVSAWNSALVYTSLDGGFGKRVWKIKKRRTLHSVVGARSSGFSVIGVYTRDVCK